MKRFSIIFSILMAGYILGWLSSVLRFDLSPFALDPPSRSSKGLGPRFEGLGLTPDQEAAIRAIRREQSAAMETRRRELGEARQTFEALVDSTKDQAQLDAAFQNLLDRKMAMERAHFERMIKIHSILTPEQIKELRERRPRWGPGGGRHRPFDKALDADEQSHPSPPRNQP
jgi:Spy/CpxP family protein refolding chaperone